MKLSARNMLAGVVTKVTDGAVNGVVSLDVNGMTVTAVITMNSIRELGLEPGKKAYAVIKASEVMIGLGDSLPMSARNQLPGTVASVAKGAVNDIVKLELAGGSVITACITDSSVERLGLKPGVKALAIVKASSVMIGVE